MSISSDEQLPTAEEKSIVDWEGPSDPENPKNWSGWKKTRISLPYICLPFVVNMGTSILASGIPEIAEEFGESEEVSTLVTTLFLLGFVFGPLIFGPLSERFGRRWPVLVGVAAFSTFTFPVAIAQNFYTILICRFFAGLFGSASMAIVGGALADMWSTPVSRGIAIDIFVATGFLGPILGPVLGGFIVQSYLGWRWTMWIIAIVGYATTIYALVTIPETYPPVMLAAKAAKLRFETKNWALHAKSEEQKTTLGDVFHSYLKRPLLLLLTEPIHLMITIYMGFIYGLLFLFFESYPIAFGEVRGWEPQLASLPLLGLFVGIFVGMGAVLFNTLTTYARKVRDDPSNVTPELRLPVMIIGAIILPIGLFWFAWTSDPHVPWPAQAVAGIFVAAAMYMIFEQGLKYIVDVYAYMANSAISSNTFVRSYFGAGFPLFAKGFYHNLGVNWATSTLAFISIGLAPVPIVFYIYGSKIRGWSKGQISKQ